MLRLNKNTEVCSDEELDRLELEEKLEKLTTLEWEDIKKKFNHIDMYMAGFSAFNPNNSLKYTFDDNVYISDKYNDCATKDNENIWKEIEF